MKSNALLALTILAAAATAQAALTINEFGYDDTGTDNICFVEIYNSGPGSVDLTAGGYKVIGMDTAPTPDVTATLTGVLAANDYYVVGQTAAVPNVDLIVAAFDPQNDMESLTLVDATNTVIDSVVYERNKANIVLPAGFGEPAFDGISTTSGGGIWMNSQFIESEVTNGTGFATVATASNATITDGRWSDGADSNNNELDFGRAVATPGTANNSIGVINMGSLPYTDSFSGSEDTILFSIPGNFSNGRIQDPTVADDLTANGYPSHAENPTAIVASPGGGNCAIVWDDTGGGASGLYNINAPIADVEVEVYIYLETALAAASEQSEPIIIRGKGDGAANLGAPAEGTVGIYFRVNRTTTDNTVTFEQAVNGVATVFGTYVVPSAGWYRMLVQAKGTKVRGVIGGTYGDNGATGVLMTGTTTITRAGGIGYNYRELVTAQNTARPITIDDLAIRVPAALAGVADWNIKD
ncbi:hypothetical protein BH09SUM1_BH09SUM1_22760 [soil metagenome]